MICTLICNKTKFKKPDFLKIDEDWRLVNYTILDNGTKTIRVTFDHKFSFTLELVNVYTEGYLET